MGGGIKARHSAVKKTEATTLTYACQIILSLHGMEGQNHTQASVGRLSSPVSFKSWQWMRRLSRVTFISIAARNHPGSTFHPAEYLSADFDSKSQ